MSFNGARPRLPAYLPPAVRLDPARTMRRLAPVGLIVLGTLYCQVYEIAFEPMRSSIWGSFVWALLTLAPWVLAALVFEGSVGADSRRSRLVLRAMGLAIIAYAASSFAALILGAGGERAFYSRVPLVAVAMLVSFIYPIPSARPSECCGNVDPQHPPVAPKEIAFASSAGNYVELHTGGRSAIWRQTMQNAERILAPSDFVRVHRSYIVSRDAIESVTRGRKGPVELMLKNGRRVPVSHRYASNLRH
jgi:hypothetical protein